MNIGNFIYGVCALTRNPKDQTSVDSSIPDDITVNDCNASNSFVPDISDEFPEDCVEANNVEHNNVEDNNVEDDNVEDDNVEDDIVKDDTVEDNTVEDDTV